MSPAPHPRMHGLTHVPGGPDPIPNLPTGTGGPGLEDVLLALGPDGIWPLYEDSGNTANDVSGNGNHLTTPVSGYVAPTWAQPAGPPGTQTAKMVRDSLSVGGSRLARNMTAFTNDFSAGGWVKVPAGGADSEMMGQGQPFHSGFTGWGLWFQGGTNKLGIMIGGATAMTNSAISDEVWYLFGFTRAAGVSTLYLNGASQAATLSGTPSAQTSIWIGEDNFGPTSLHGSDLYLSWCFLFGTPLSGGDWLNIYEAGIGENALAEGQAWVSDGAGGAGWGQVTTAGIADDAVTSAKVLDGELVDADIAAGADIDPVKLDHPGGTTLFLRGDGTWAAAGNPADDPAVWMPLSTVAAGVPELVWDGDDNLIPTLTPLA